MTRPTLTTLPPSPLAASSEAAPEGAVGLTLLWSREEPQRVGEVFLLPSRVGSSGVVGRGPEVGGPLGVLGLCRQRPGSNEATGALRSPRVSRVQLRLQVQPGAGVYVENVGRAALRVNGLPTAGQRVEPGDIVELVDEALLRVELRPLEIPPLRVDLPHPPFGAADALGIVGESPAAWALREQIAIAASLATHVLVLGPSGSGKELVARGLHRLSPRGGRPLIARNAATLPEGLLDAELFGTAANFPQQGMKERPGLIGAADGSTLFLDEIGEMPVGLQSHLLRVLDEGEYQRLGEASMRKVDLRLVGATNRPEADLKHDLRARFLCSVRVPGLDERREDIPLIVAHLLSPHARGLAASGAAGGERVQPGPDLIRALMGLPFRTHVRELHEILIEALSQGRGGMLSPPARLLTRAPTPPTPSPGPALTLGQEDTQRLAIFRRFGFQIGECVVSGGYPGNRQTADLHLRQLICRALVAAELDEAAATRLLAGGEPEVVQLRLTRRVTGFVENLRARLQASEATQREVERERVLREYKGFDPMRRLLELLG